MNINLTLIGQTLAFALFVLFCMKYVWPPILAAMQERAKRIADGLAATERAERDLELAQEEATRRMTDAKREAAGIIDAANKRAGRIIDEAKAQARVEGDRLKEAAQAEINQAANRAREQLRGEVAALALFGAEKILEAEIDGKRHNAMLERLAAGLGAAGNGS